MQCDRGSWLGTFTVDIKTTGTLTWAYTWLNTLTITHQYKRPVSDGAFWLQPAVRRTRSVHRHTGQSLRHVHVAEYRVTRAHVASWRVTKSVPRVRIPLAPRSLDCREVWLYSVENCLKCPQFRESRPQTGLEKL
jgi:hypothetical protein